MTEPQSHPRIQRGARRFRRFAYLAAGLAVLCVLSEITLAVSPLWRGGKPAAALSDGFGQLILAVPVLCFVYGLMRARRLFLRLQSGEVFGPNDSRDLVWMGWSLVAGAGWSVTIAGMVPPLTGPAAQALAALGLAARDLALLALGFALVVIGQVIGLARRLKLDNDSFL